MKRKYLIMLIVLILLSAIIFLGYKIYNDISYVPRIDSFKEVNITSNEIVQDTSQTVNLIL
mgnify:CR=1 FL=1